MLARQATPRRPAAPSGVRQRRRHHDPRWRRPGPQYDAGTAINTELAGRHPGGIRRRGRQTVDLGGTHSIAAGGTGLSNGGVQYDADTATGTTVAGGVQIVVSGGTGNGETITSGTLELRQASFNLGAESGGGTGTIVTDPPLTNNSMITPPHG